MSSILGLFKGDDSFNTLHNVKNPAINRANTALLGDWNAGRTSSANSLADYISQYIAGTPAAAARTGQETGNIDQYFNGGIDSQLAGLRTRTSRDVMDAANQAGQEAIRASSGNRLGDQGTGGSYATRQLMGALMPIRTQAALQNDQAARADWGYSQAAKLGLTGARTQLADQLSQRALVPDQMRQALLKSQESGLSGIEGIDTANNFYGVQKHQTDLDKWQNFLNSSQSEMGQAAGTYASLAGAGGGSGGGGGGSL